MRTKSTGGFTLIELLIVIAIIGILAAVLIPNLMNARTQAAERAAQAHSQNVYTAAIAALASDATATPATLAAATPTCVAAASFGAAGISQYGFNAAPAGAHTCTVAAAGTSDFTVTVITTNNTYTNGARTGAGAAAP